jgi:hypothetical protein
MAVNYRGLGRLYDDLEKTSGSKKQLDDNTLVKMPVTSYSGKQGTVTIKREASADPNFELLLEFEGESTRSLMMDRATFQQVTKGMTAVCANVFSSGACGYFG